MWEALIPMALSIIFEVLKNPEQVRRLKRALRKLRDILMGLPLEDKS